MLLLAYLAEISAEYTKVPAVILLLFLGWLARSVSGFLQISIPDLKFLLPLLGTIGLILIVLEGALELELNKSKVDIIKKSFVMALVPVVIMGLSFGFIFSWVGGVSFRTGLMNALPLCVISSSIAIPSARNISFLNRELVIYESSFSDIIGVLLFNFVVIHESFNAISIGLFLLQLILIILISMISVTGLSYLLTRIKHHITYAPIILLVILIYELAKAFDLSGLLFILVFGLFLGNIPELKKFYLIAKMDTERLHHEVVKFRIITVEATFIVRSMFFLLFGFLMETNEFLNIHTIPWTFGIVIVIFGVRWLFLRIFKLPVNPLLYFSPRGLVTILLFISVLPGRNIAFINNSLIIQIIIVTVLILLFSLLRNPLEKKTD